jgi:hypothetical protein
MSKRGPICLYCIKAKNCPNNPIGQDALGLDGCDEFERDIHTTLPNDREIIIKNGVITIY